MNNKCDQAIYALLNRPNTQAQIAQVGILAETIEALESENAKLRKALEIAHGLIDKCDKADCKLCEYRRSDMQMTLETARKALEKEGK